MKKKYYIILIIFCLLTFVLNIPRTYASLPLVGKLIIIDPGHGGVDPGTIHEKIFEKDINLSISKQLEIELSKLGASVLLTRDGDYDISSPGVSWRKRSDFDNRINLINNSKANLYLSIHINYLNNTSYSGAQVFYLDNNKTLAQQLQNDLNKHLNSNREIKQIPQGTYMYDKLNIPGVLIECGFLSNYNERILLQDNLYQEKIANTIANSLVNYF